MPGAEPNTRERIINEAMRLFAERGFAGTSVGEIERAAGLAPRAGGLYKHFMSKQEVLEAGIERNVSEIERLRPTMETLPLGDLRAELALIGGWGLEALANEMPLVKVVQKDGDRFPELAAAFRDRIVAPAQAQGAAFVSRLLGDALDEHEVAAIAALARLALVGYRVEEAMFGPREVSEDEFLEAWVDMLMAFVERRRAADAPISSKAG
jgi:AcrR family transcriptional regulator